MKRNYSLGKVDYNGRGRKINRVAIEVELREKDGGKTVDMTDAGKHYELSICGEIWNGSGSDVLSCGQNLDEIAKLFPAHPTVKALVALWKRFHLNDMKAGTRTQNALVDEYLAANGNIHTSRAKRYDYTEICEFLKSRDMLTDGGYQYGHGWLVDVIPAPIVEALKAWLANQDGAMESISALMKHKALISSKDSTESKAGILKMT